MKRVIGIIGLLVGNAILFGWGAFKFTMDWVGRSTVFDDFQALKQNLPNYLQWLYTSTPWWTPTLLAVLTMGALVWLAWPSESAASGDERRPSKAFKETLFRAELTKAHRTFRSVDEHIRLGGVPGSIPHIEEQVARFRSVEISLEKHGVPAPWLNFQTDPIGYFQRNTSYLNLIVPMINDGHLAEARKTARTLARQLQGQHPGIMASKSPSRSCRASR